MGGLKFIKTCFYSYIAGVAIVECSRGLMILGNMIHGALSNLQVCKQMKRRKDINKKYHVVNARYRVVRNDSKRYHFLAMA